MTHLGGVTLSVAGDLGRPLDAVVAALRERGATVVEAPSARCAIALVGTGADAVALRADALGVPTAGADALRRLLEGETVDAVLGAPATPPPLPPMPQAKPFRAPKRRRSRREPEVVVPLARELPREVVPRDLSLDDAALGSLARRVNAASDATSREELVRGAARDVGAGVVWLRLWRDGRVDLPAWPQHWEPLAFVSHAMSAAELMRFLAGAKPDTDHRWGMHLPSWPSSLDRIAMEVYLRDPWESVPDALPAWAKRGLAWVCSRAGDLAWRPSELVDRWLAAAHIDGVLGSEVHAFSDGAVIGLRTVERGERTSAWWPFVTSLTTVERWPRAILDEALRRARAGRDVPWSRAIEGVAVAEVADLTLLLDHAGSEQDAERCVRDALLQRRADAPDALSGAVLASRADRWTRRASVPCAILRVTAYGARPSDALVDALTLDPGSSWLSWISNEAAAQLGPRQRDDLRARAGVWRVDDLVARSFSAAPAQIEALRAIDRDRAVAALRRRLAHPYGLDGAAFFAHAVDDEALHAEVIEAALARAGEERDLTAIGLGLLPERALPSLVAALSRCPRGPRSRELSAAITLALARLADAGSDWPAEHDPALRFDAVSSPYRWGFWADVLAKALLALPPLRAQAALLDALDPADVEVFARAFRFVGALPTEGVLRRAFAGLIRLPPSLSHDQRHAVNLGLATLHDRRPWCQWALRAGAVGDVKNSCARYA